MNELHERAPVEVLTAVLTSLQHQPAAAVSLHVAVDWHRAWRVAGRDVVDATLVMAAVVELFAIWRQITWRYWATAMTYHVHIGRRDTPAASCDHGYLKAGFPGTTTPLHPPTLVCNFTMTSYAGKYKIHFNLLGKRALRLYSLLPLKIPLFLTRDADVNNQMS